MARFSPELATAEDDNAMNVDNEEKPQESGAEDEDGSEYEIEEIMDAKRGAFPEVNCFHLSLSDTMLKMTRFIRVEWATS